MVAPLCLGGRDDPFGEQAFERPWHPQDSTAKAREKVDAAFDLVDILGQPYSCWHDADIRPDQGNFADNLATLNKITDYIGETIAGAQCRLSLGHGQGEAHGSQRQGRSADDKTEAATAELGEHLLDTATDGFIELSEDMARFEPSWLG